MEERVKAFAEYLGVEPEEIEVSGDEYTVDGETYLVLNYDEA